MRTPTLGALALATVIALPPSATAEIVRERLVTQSDPGIEIVMRRVREDSIEQRGDPVVLLHGARVPGVLSFDLSVEGGSLGVQSRHLLERV